MYVFIHIHIDVRGSRAAVAWSVAPTRNGGFRLKLGAKLGVCRGSTLKSTADAGTPSQSTCPNLEAGSERAAGE